MPNSKQSRPRSYKTTLQQTPVKAWTDQPYPAYKDSGVEWLGKVPEHWEVRCLGRFGRFLKGSGGTKADETKEGVPCVRYGDLYTRHQFHITESNACIAPHRVVAYTPVSYGDVLFAGSGETLEEIGKSAVNLIRGPAVCGGDVIIFRPTLELDAEFIGWSMDCRQAASQKAQMGRGITVMHIYSNDLKYLAVALPPLPEQHAIARFLDHANQRIQRHIHAKEKLIKLLEEQKQVITHQAVTGQIDVRTGQPYPAYKDSEAEWLGKVPEHWKTRRLKYTVSFTGGGTPSKANASFWSGHISWVSPKDMNRARLDDTTDHISEEAVEASAANIVAPGAVLLVVRSGILSRTIPVAINTVPMALNQDMKALRPRNGIVESEYLYGLIAGNQVFFLREWTKQGATVESIEHHLLANSLIPIPPLPEQHAIARFLTHTDHCISQHRAAIKRQINLLHEYRTRLIADVVTGKLDVRKAAAELPGHEPSTTDNACQDGMALAAQVWSRHP